MKISKTVVELLEKNEKESVKVLGKELYDSLRKKDAETMDKKAMDLIRKLILESQRRRV